MQNMGIGFVGLGQMGRGMARNLSRDNGPFYVFDQMPEALDGFASTGAVIANPWRRLRRIAGCYSCVFPLKKRLMRFVRA